MSPPSPPVPKACHRARQSHSPEGGPDRSPRLEIDGIAPPPSDIRSQHSCPRHSRSRSDLGGTPPHDLHPYQVTRREIQSPASPAAALVRASAWPRAAE